VANADTQRSGVSKNNKRASSAPATRPDGTLIVSHEHDYDVNVPNENLYSARSYSAVDGGPPSKSTSIQLL